MKYVTYGLLAIGAAALAVGCAPHESAAQSASDSKTEAAEAARTIKPGAALAFSHKFRSPPRTGIYSVVEITIKDDYDDGVMRATAIGDDGLEVFGAPAAFSYAMAGPAPGVWDVSVKPLADGVHYLKINAQVEKDGVPGPARAYAVRIEVGDAASEKADGAVEAIEMQADETIE